MEKEISQTISSKKIMIVDGYGLFFRAYYAMPEWEKNGLILGAVYGFANSLLKIIQEIGCSHILIALDSGSKTFRNELYSEYKATRQATPENLKHQFDILDQFIDASCLCSLRMLHFEADDIIAAAAKQASENNNSVVIVSGDKDLMQLLDDRITIYHTSKKIIIDSNWIKENLGLNPAQIADYLALVGDNSDNIPGVKSIGKKTALALLQKHHNISGIYAALEKDNENISLKNKSALIIQKEMAYLSLKLTTLDQKINLPIKINDLYLPSENKLADFDAKYGFNFAASFTKTINNQIKKQQSANLQKTTPLHKEIAVQESLF